MLSTGKRYEVARLIGRLTRLGEDTEERVIMLLGPGRWGTSTPTLGVPVSFSEIHRVSILCEICTMTGDVIPEVSLATHFFSEMVEADILYLALFPNQKDNLINWPFLEETKNKLTELLPDAEEFVDFVRVIDIADLPGTAGAKLHADTVKQHVLCSLRQIAE
jgi:hypothetical protein